MPSFLAPFEEFRTYLNFFKLIKDTMKNITYEVIIVPHHHFDPEWLDTWENFTKKNAKELLYGYVLEATDNPEFKTIFDQAVEIREIEKSPMAWDLFKKCVRAGKIDLVGGVFVQQDTNMPSGKSQLENIVYGNRYMIKNFGVKPTIAWNPDAFGINAQLKEMYEKAGYRAFIHWRGVSNRYSSHQARRETENIGRLAEVWWKGLTEGEMLMSCMLEGYGIMYPSDRRNDKAIELMKSRVYSLIEKSKTGVIFFPYGWDHSIVDSEVVKTVKKVEKLVNKEGKYKVKMRVGSLTDYVDELTDRVRRETDKVRGDGIEIDTVRGELQAANGVFPGTYFSRIKVKQTVREAERTSYNAEVLATLATEFGYEYPEKDFEEAMLKNLFNTFHDDMCGCGIDGIYMSTLKRGRECIKTFKRHANASARKIAENIDTAGNGTPLVVFNTNSWDRDDVSIIKIDGDVDSVSIEDADGDSVPYHILNRRKKEIMFRASVPSFGYRVYFLKNKSGKKTIRRRPHRIENDFFKLEFDRKTHALKRLYDKRLKKDLLKSTANVLSFEEEKEPKSPYINVEYTDKVHIIEGPDLYHTDPTGRRMLSTEFPSRFAVEESDIAYRIIISGNYALKDTIEKFREPFYVKGRQEIIVYKDLPRIDFVTKIDKKIGKNIRIGIEFPFDVENGKAVYEIPLGTIERRDGLWPAQNWVDVSNQTHGVALINDGLPAYEVNGSNVKLLVLRACEYMSLGDAGPVWKTNMKDKTPEPLALENGSYEFRYSLYSHEGPWTNHNLAKIGREHNNKLMAMVEQKHEGKLPKEYSFMGLDSDGIMVEAMKKSYETDDIAMWLYESKGKVGEGDLTTYKNRVFVTDLLENVKEELKPNDKGFHLRLNPYEILPIKISKRPRNYTGKKTFSPSEIKNSAVLYTGTITRPATQSELKVKGNRITKSDEGAVLP